MAYIPVPEFFQQAFIYAGGVNTGIENSRSSASYGINNNGQVVGSMYLTPPFSGEPPPHAFIYNSSDGSTVTPISQHTGRESIGLAINNAGDITGYLSTGTCSR